MSLEILDTRHPKERGSHLVTIPTLLESQAKLVKLYSVVGDYRLAGKQILLSEMGLSSKRKTWRHEEGVAPAFVQDVVSRVIETSGHVNGIFKGVALQHVRDEVENSVEMMRRRTQVLLNGHDNKSLMVTFAHLMHDTDTIGGSFTPEDLEATGRALLKADFEAATSEDSDEQRRALMLYVIHYLYRDKLSFVDRIKMSQRDSLKVIEHARNQVQTQFELSLFCGNIDETVAKKLSELPSTRNIDLDELLSHPGAYAMATTFAATPFTHRGVHQALSPLDREYAGAVRQLTEVAYFKAVHKCLFPNNSQALHDLRSALQSLLTAGKVKAIDINTVKKIREGFQKVEDHIEKVMLEIGGNVINCALKVKSEKYSVTSLLQPMADKDRKEIKDEAEKLIDAAADAFACGQTPEHLVKLSLPGITATP